MNDEELEKLGLVHYTTGVLQQVDGARVPYDQAYFDKYVKYSRTSLGRALTLARAALVDRWFAPLLHGRGWMVDVGIGCGDFIEAMSRDRSILGADVNPAACQWLRQRGRDYEMLTGNPPIAALTLWDTLEHLPDPRVWLDRVENGGLLFVSLPIFPSASWYGLENWRHYRPGEHLWYFTNMGLTRYLGDRGFDCIAGDDCETRLGRHDIHSYVFRKE